MKKNITHAFKPTDTFQIIFEVFSKHFYRYVNQSAGLNRENADLQEFLAHFLRQQSPNMSDIITVGSPVFCMQWKAFMRVYLQTVEKNACVCARERNGMHCMFVYALLSASKVSSKTTSEPVVLNSNLNQMFACKLKEKSWKRFWKNMKDQIVSKHK